MEFRLEELHWFPEKDDEEVVATFMVRGDNGGEPVDRRFKVITDKTMPAAIGIRLHVIKQLDQVTQLVMADYHGLVRIPFETWSKLVTLNRWRQYMETLTLLIAEKYEQIMQDVDNDGTIDNAS